MIMMIICTVIFYIFGHLKHKEILRHYENTPIQYITIVHSCKNEYFQMKNCDVVLIFAQNIDCGYTLEPPQ